MADEPRPPAQRKKDAFARLETDIDMWVATGDDQGVPCMVPLSFLWHDERLYFATVPTNPTAHNIVKHGLARAVLGHTRDVVLIDGKATQIGDGRLPEAVGDAYAAKCGWDPRDSKSYEFFELLPAKVEVWRELNEHADRELMRDGTWLV